MNLAQFLTYPPPPQLATFQKFIFFTIIFQSSATSLSGFCSPAEPSLSSSVFCFGLLLTLLSTNAWIKTVTHRFFKFRALLLSHSSNNHSHKVNVQTDPPQNPYLPAKLLAHKGHWQEHVTFIVKFFSSCLFPCQILHPPLPLSLYFSFPNRTKIKNNQMVAKDYDHLTCAVVVVKMGRIMQSIDYSRLFWLFFGVFSHVHHEGKPRI